jgi:hypothetical protein
MSRAFWIVSVAAVLVVGGIAWWHWSPTDRPSAEEVSAGDGAAQDDLSPFDSGRAVASLKTAGWDDAAARTVIALNAPFLAVVAESSPSECDGIVRRLARLGDPRHAYARKRLESMPKLAGLMANTLDSAMDGPERVATAIGADVNAEALISLFALSATGDDAVALARVINRDRDLAVRLAGLQDTNLLSWLEPKDMGDAAASEVYRTWARRIITDALSTNAEQGLEEAFAILSMHGERVAAAVQVDSAFRSALMSRVYPVFRRVVLAVEDDGFSRDLYYMYPQIWEFIHRYPKDAENLLMRVGPASVDVLMDPRFAGCTDGLLDVLSSADQRVIDGLLDERICQNPRFAAFLERPLPAKTRVAALQALAEAPERANRNLEEWSAMTRSGLVDALGEPATSVVTWLPGYSAAVLARKIAQGRPVTGMDVVFAAVDAAEVVLIAKGGGAALKAIATSARKSAAKKIATEAAEQVAKTESRGLAPWVMRGAQKAGRQMLTAVRDKLVIDMTPIVRGLYKRSGLNAKTFRYLDRLDARVFMRKDRRVVFDLAGDHPLGRFMSETAANAGVEKALENEIVMAGGRAAFVEGSKAVEAASRNISAWWLMVGDGMVERLAVAGVAP